jgi:hypothetical protein
VDAKFDRRRGEEKCRENFMTINFGILVGKPARLAGEISRWQPSPFDSNKMNVVGEAR